MQLCLSPTRCVLFSCVHLHAIIYGSEQQQELHFKRLYYGRVTVQLTAVLLHIFQANIFS